MSSIYIADLAAYNAGYLVGEWVDLEIYSTVEEIDERVQRILAAGDHLLKMKNEWSGPHEEWAIHDYDDFGPLDLGEYEQFETILKHAENICGDSGSDEDAAAYFAWVGAGISDDPGDYDRSEMVGPYESGESWAWQMFEDCYSETAKMIEDSSLSCYITFDAAGFARDADNLFEYNGKVWEYCG